MATATLPLAFAGGAAGAFAGYRSARANNKAVKRAAKLSFERINDFITQNRVDKVRNTERLAREAQIELGNTLNIAPEGLSAIETIASRIVRGVASDQFTIDEEARRREIAALAESENVAAAANSQTVNPTSAAISSGLSMASAGMQLGSAIDQSGQAEIVAQNQAALGQQALQQSQSETALANSRLEGQRLANQYYRGWFKEQLQLNQGLQASPYLNLAERIFAPFFNPTGAISR